MLTEDAEYIDAPRGLKIRECTNVGIVLDNPFKRLVTLPQRNLSMKYLAGELAFYLAGSDSLEFISYYSSSWNKLSVDGKTVVSAYGKRLFKELTPDNDTQFAYCLRQLRNDRDSRKAVMVIYRASDSIENAKDNPCTMSIQFLIRDNKLHATTTMRSNDVWFGFPYDIAFFTLVQEIMLTSLRIYAYPNLEMGSYTHFVGSLHAYERNWEDLRDISDVYARCLYEDEHTYPDDPRYIDGGKMPVIDHSFMNELPLFLLREEDIRHGLAKSEQFLYDSETLNWLTKALGGS